MIRPVRRALIAVVIVAAMGLTACSSGSGLTKAQADAMAWPEAPVAAAIAESESGEILVNNDGGPRQLASTAKLLTAILVVEKMPLGVDEPGASITITVDDATLTAEIERQDGLTVPVSVGGELTQRDLLAGMLLASANNYAEILAERAFGSQQAFLEAAADWAKQRELGTLHLADAAGLSPDTVGTAAELVAVAREALRVPAIAELVAMQWYSAGVASFENTNLLLGDASFIGLKTGHLSATSHNLVFARKGSSGRTVVGAVLGEQSSGFARQSATQLSETALAQLESE